MARPYRSPIRHSDPRVTEALVSQTIELRGGNLRLLQPKESAEIPDDHQVEWAPIAPYWSIIWRSGVALARELDDEQLSGLRVLELGCGLAAPSIVAARAGADVLATDAFPEALELATRNAIENDVEIETAQADWTEPRDLIKRAPFDLVLGADILYERYSVAALLSLLPQLAPRAWIAEPGRPAADAFLEQANRLWNVETRVRGVVRIHRLTLL